VLETGIINMLDVRKPTNWDVI